VLIIGDALKKLISGKMATVELNKSLELQEAALPG